MNNNRKYDAMNNNNQKRKNSLKSNIIFIVTVFLFLMFLIIAKRSYASMQDNEMNRIAGKWYICEEKGVEELGNLEAEFKSNGTFDIYYSDSSLSCMNGKYSITYKGMMKLNCDKNGFNPPEKWNCKEKSSFKYSLNDDKLVLTYKGSGYTFVKKGEKEDSVEKVSDELHNMYFINKQAKMLVSFYSGSMYIYNLKDTSKVFGDNKEVLGDVCLFGEYKQVPSESKITVIAENEGDVAENPMWPQMKELGEYVFLYRIEGKYDKLVLQYEDKAYEFKKITNE